MVAFSSGVKRLSTSQAGGVSTSSRIGSMAIVGMRKYSRSGSTWESMLAGTCHVRDGVVAIRATICMQANPNSKTIRNSIQSRRSQPWRLS
jgi:hypothetical protein